jgi:hypothetical protein
MNENSRIGFIYKISGYGLTYVGSTIQPICERKSTHLSQYRDWIKRDRTGWKCASCDIFDKGNDWSITVIETILTDTNKTGLLEREQYWINNINALSSKIYVSNKTNSNTNSNSNTIVNKNQPILNDEDRKEYKRQWAESDRRAKGIAPREKVLTADPQEYFRKKRAEYRANMTAEEKEEHLAQRRANRKPLTEEQKEKARQRAKKQREDKKQNL